MRYTLGIDIGIASIGWCMLDEDKRRIENLGVRTFVAAEQPKTGAPLAEPRRLARSMRRRIRRKGHRMDRLKSLLIRQGLLSTDKLSGLYKEEFLEDPYTLRSRGLDEKLETAQWARVLLHIAKRRGFKSNRKSEAKAKESGQMLSCIKENLSIMAQKGYRTVGEMLLKDEKFVVHKRNKAGGYINTISRDMLETELHLLFAAQRMYGNIYASEEFEQAFCQIFLSQRPFASKEDIEKMVGKCTFEPDEMRAPKHSYTAERFVLFQKLNNLKLLSPVGKTGLTHEQCQQVESLSYTLKEVKYEQIRKALGIPEDWQFAGLSYYRKGVVVNPEKAVFISMTGYHTIKKTIIEKLGSPTWEVLKGNTELLDQIAISLTLYKTDEDIVAYLRDQGIVAYLRDQGICEGIVEALLEVSFDKFQHLSLKAMRKILPLLESGYTYGDACEQAGYCHWNPNRKTEKCKYLPKITKEDIRNPVVLRALSQARQVINAVIRKYGSPYRIHIEVAREIAKPYSERKDIAREQENYRNMKQQLKNEFQEHFGFEPKSQDLVKYRLYREQACRCPYTQEYFDPHRLLEDGYAEVDHIIPYSRSFDDSLANKVLVKASENRKKGNQTPYEYFGADEDRWYRFEEWVRVHIKNNSKRNRLLRKDYSEKAENEMKSRNLNDTRYISRYLSQMLKQYLIFNNNEDKEPVLMINGQLTAYLRAQWGLIKVRENGDLHHALDAAVIAASSQSMVRRISQYSQAKELYTYEKTAGRQVFPQPWTHFREEIISRLSDDPAEFLSNFGITSYTLDELAALKPVFVSRMPTRKESGQAHKETICSKKYLREQYKVKRIALTELKWNKAKDDFESDIHGKERDWRLYEALKEQVRKFGGDVKKAFSEPFYKPVVNSSQKPRLVRSVKIRESGDSGVEINGGIADNGNMVKVLVYSKNNKYYLVPVYVADLVKPKSFVKAIAVFKPESEWIVIDDSFKFEFVLYPNDLVRIKTKKEEILGYYKSCNRRNGQLTIETHDRHKLTENQKDPGWLISFGTIKSFEKLHVDPLGQYYKAVAERK
ncbi:CRISPR-associated endonuclease Cas9 [Sporomusa carbonis]|uniref:type II CRISPR RNA-guided endonuclease Cas9 n=1 Tax=Sporomusa carbonis TaxID=3076075 RepID=UPI003A6BB75B